MNIGERYSDNKIYKGIKYYDQMPLMSEDLLEYEDLTNRKTDLVLTNLFENGLLNTPGLVTNLDGIFLSGPVNLLINGDVSIIQTDDSRPIVSMTDIEEAAQVSGSVCILGWYQHLTMSSVMRSYGGVDNSVIPNDLYNEDLRLQPSTRYQFRWTPIILPQSDVDPSQSQSSHFTCRVTDRDITGAKLSSTSVLSSIDRIGSLYLTDVPSSWDYVVEDHMYLIPLIRYTYEESTLSNTVFYDRIQVASGESGKVMTYAEFMRLTPDQQNHGEYYIPDYPEGPVIINGHTIVDENGTSFPARAKLKFINCDITDDSTNDTTIIEAKSNGTIIVVPTVTNTSIIYDGTEQSPTIIRDTIHTYIQGDYEATNYGTYTFTIGLSGVNDVWSDNTTAPKTYTWSINYDGGTITPINDIQTWLLCGGIVDKAYTTLNEILADTTTLVKLMADDNAVDYLVRSTSWVSGITADQTAMNAVGASDYCSDTLLADSTWCAAICNSTYFESVLPIKVPTMTSDTTPSGKVGYSSYYDTYVGWKAFTLNNDGTKYWLPSSSDSTKRIYYKFTQKVKVYKAVFTAYNQALKTFHIQGSDDESSWNNVLNVSSDSSTIYHSYNFAPSDSYYAYAVKIDELYGSGNQTAFYDAQFYGRTTGGVQTWLKCANIDDKSYTTLSEVLADHETLYALINNNNAMDYLVRSTSWVSDITADETAMEYIGHKNYASDTLLDDSTWCTAICNSAYFKKVLSDQVPKMTSNTTPSGVASASSIHDASTDAYKAFDKYDLNVWHSAYPVTLPQYVAYKFEQPKIIKKVVVVCGGWIKNFNVEASNDLSNWIILGSGQNPSNAQNTVTILLDNQTEYLSYRISGTTSYASDNSTNVNEVYFYGRTDITENQIDIYSAASDTVYYMDNGSPVTVCTTDTTGHGTVSKSSLPNGTYTLYSTVAKDPENLSNDYSKSVTIADNTLEIKVMPEGALYWYGNLCMWLTGGWENPGSYQYYEYGVSGTVAFNTNKITIDQPTTDRNINIVGTTNSLTTGTYSTIKQISKYSNGNDMSPITKSNSLSGFSSFYVASWFLHYNKSNNTTDGRDGWGIDSADKKHFNTTGTETKDFYFQSRPTGAIDIFAVWLE